MQKVQATLLITAAFKLSMNNKTEMHEAWIAHSFKLKEVAGTVHLINAQRNGELDLLLRQLGEEAPKKPTGDIDYSLSIRSLLSNAWILSAYEMVRAADEQIRLKGEENNKLTKFKKRLGLVRVPTAKGEIQGKKGKNSNLNDIVLANSDGSNPKKYSNDGSYMPPISFCAETGSIVWCPVDAETKQSVWIRRIDLSDELLALFT
jgi:hypothetical protein